MKHPLNGLSETLLIPLWARATETGRPNPIVKDDLAVKIVGKMDYDFSKFNRAWKSQVGVAIRTMLLDSATKGFIDAHPDCVIINLGAGLDTRYFRIDNGGIRWYDLDLPEPIRVRGVFFEESPRYRMIAKSVFDLSWIKDVHSADLPVLIIAEGILMYFEEARVRDLMNSLVAAFPGAEMLFEMMTPALVKKSKQHDTVRKIGVTFKWGIQHGREMEAFNPAIRFVEEWNYFDYHKDRWRWMGWLALIPWFKRRFNDRIVRLRFA